MSSHSESIRFLITAREMVDVTVQQQQIVQGHISEITSLLAQAVGDTALGAQMDQMQAQIGEHCDYVIRALVSLSEHLGAVIAQMGGAS